MAKKGSKSNGQNRLEEAMAMLIQNQATFLSQLADIERETSQRFKRIEGDMAAILRVLAEHGRLLSDHSRLLEQLPEAVGEKIGFKREG